LESRLPTRITLILGYVMILQGTQCGRLTFFPTSVTMDVLDRVSAFSSMRVRRAAPVAVAVWAFMLSITSVGLLRRRGVDFSAGT
jgi:hypothetical protein